MKEKNRVSSYLGVIVGCYFSLLFFDHALSEAEFLNTLLLANPITCYTSEGKEVRLSKHNNGKEITNGKHSFIFYIPLMDLKP